MYMKRLGQVLDTLQVSVAHQVGCFLEALMSCCRGSVASPLRHDGSICSVCLLDLLCMHSLVLIGLGYC